MTLYLYKFNNYYNRISKYYATLDEYQEHGTILGIFFDVNFIPNDGITTSQVLNYNGTENPDYLIVADETGAIVSRWFVMDSVRTRMYQYSITLYRDLIADYREEIMNAPMFIEKATLPLGDPFLFNKENIAFNQIKTSEHLLKDKTGCAWIVGYLDKSFSGNISVLPTNLSINYDYTSFAQYQYDTYRNEEFKAQRTPVFRFNWWDGAGNVPSRTSYCFAWNDLGASISPVNPNPTTGTYYSNYIYKKSSGTEGVGWKMLVGEEEYGTIANTKVQPFVQSQNWANYPVSSYISDIKSRDDLARLQQENGKLMRVGDKIYKIIVYATSSNNSIIQTVPRTSTLGIKMEELATELKKNYEISRSDEPIEPTYEYECSYYGYMVDYQEVSLAQFTATIPADRLHSKHLPYDVFCIPCGDIGIGALGATTNKDYAMLFANEIIRTAGANLYDIQLLPYCPVLDRIVGNYTTNDARVIINVDNGDFYLNASESEVVCAGIWVDNPDFELSVYYDIEQPKSAIETKVMNECDLYRLVSPNYNGEFEFSPAKNNGVSEFVVDCSYKPFTPYIKVSPKFDSLYGKDFDDARGLICGGDFSLTQATDPWIQYQIQNKNYQVMFDRQIQSMDITNNVQREQEKWARITGVLGGAVAGAAAGSMPGGVAGSVGSLVGGAAGAAVSWTAGNRDRELQEQIRQEARDMAIDQFGYQLQNIAARPASLTKVSSLNKNNKLFPFIEYFTCTEAEKQAFRNKLHYNGMTVMAIGTINNYIQLSPSYIKGKLIRLEGIADDYHMVHTIGEELNKGVFI